MAETLSVTLSADISALESALAAATEKVKAASDAFADDFARAGRASGDIGRDAGKAADEIVRIEKQTADKIIEGRQQLNNALYTLGQESLAQWNEQELALAKEKYDADLKALQQEEAQGNLAHAKFLAEKALLDQDYANKVQQIWQQTASRERQQEQSELQDFIKTEDDKLSAALATLDREYSRHQISDQERHDLEHNLTTAIEQEELARFDATNAALQKGTDAYEKAMKERQAIVERFAKQAQTQDDQLVSEETQKWQQLSTAMASSIGNAVKGMIFQHMTWQRAVGTIIEGVADSFLQMGEKMLANWIQNLIMQEVMTRTTTTTSALDQITAASGVAGANMTASWAGAPWPLDMAAPEMGASAAAEALSFGSLVGLDVGAWELPHDMPALLHQGEMVVPQNFAEGMRAGSFSRGGDTVFNTHYYPTINAREPQSLKEMLAGSGAELFDAIQRGYRTGLPMRPSMRTAY